MPTVIGLFEDAENLRKALDELYRRGFEEDVQVIDHAGMSTRPDGTGATVVASPVTDARFATGADRGPLVAGGAGTAGSVPVPVPLPALFDALTGMDVPEEEARFFSEGLKEDGKLIVVRTSDDRSAEVYEIFREAGANRTNDPNRD